MIAASRPSSAARSLVLAYAVGLVPAVALAVGQPAWSRVDEPAHYDVIAQYAAGVYPHDSVTTIRPQTLEVMERTGVFGFVVDNAYAKPDVASGFQSMPTGISSSAQVLWIRRHGFQFSYEAFQPPLYYLLALPAWLAGNGVDGALGALYAVRIFDALLAALLAPLSMLIALRLWPAQRAVGWGAALLTSVLPGVAVNLTSVTNDVLVSVLGALCILVAIGGTWNRRRIILLGLLFGAALLTKTTALGIAPALALALLQKPRGGGVRPLVSVMAIAAACMGPWIVSNLAIYGEVITTKEQLAMSAFPQRTADPGFWSVSTLHSFVTFWTGDPFLSIPGAVPLALIAAFITALSLAGLWRLRKRADAPRDVMRVVGLAAVGAGVVSVASPLLAAFDAPGRLAYVGLGAVVALVALGLWIELRSPRLRWGLLGLFGALSLAGQALLVYPAPAAPSHPGNPVIVTRAQLSGHGSFAGVTVYAFACADDASRDTWLAVTIVNNGQVAAEWSQHAEIDALGSRIATSDYARSTQLPMSLEPGQPYTGWLWLGPSDQLRRYATTKVVFRDVAADGYRTIGNIEIDTPLC